MVKLGFTHKRKLYEAFRADPDFLAEVELIEGACEEAAQHNIFLAMASLGMGSPETSQAYLTMKWKVRQMAEARLERKRVAALEEREMRLKEGLAAQTAARPDLTGLSPDALARYEALLAEIEALAVPAAR